MNLRRVGAQAEEAACAFLQAAGYTIVARNVRAGHGEVDIVARKADVTAFVEVKYRRSERFGSPAEAVTPLKRRRIIDAATCYAAAQGLLESKLRFDIIELDGKKIRHIQGAFDASEGF